MDWELSIRAVYLLPMSYLKDTQMSKEYYI